GTFKVALSKSPMPDRMFLTSSEPVAEINASKSAFRSSGFILSPLLVIFSGGVREEIRYSIAIGCRAVHTIVYSAPAAEMRYGVHYLALVRTAPDQHGPAPEDIAA